MADVISWTNQLRDQLKDELEWQVIKAEIKMVTISPAGELTIHKLEYQGKGELYGQC